MKKIALQALTLTLVCINLSLIALLWAKENVPIDKGVPSLTTDYQPYLSTEYDFELINIIQKGNHRIENYQQLQIEYDKNGNIIRKIPTNEHIYLRYWTSTHANQ